MGFAHRSNGNVASGHHQRSVHPGKSYRPRARATALDLGVTYWAVRETRWGRLNLDRPGKEWQLRPKEKPSTLPY